MIIKLYKEARKRRADLIFRVYLLLNMLLSLFGIFSFCVWQTLRGEEDVLLLQESVFLK